MANYKKYDPKVSDKILLITSAAFVGLLLFYFLYFLNLIKLADEWIGFISGCIIYIVGFYYLLFTSRTVKKIPYRFVVLALSIAFIVLPIVIFYLLFYFKILELPKRMSVYLVFSILFVPSLSILFDYCLGLLVKKKRED